MPEGDNFVPPDVGKEKPTPEETAEAYKNLRTQADLNEMLAEVEKVTGGKQILGPDGQPIKDPEEQKAALKAKFDDYRREKIKELGARVHHLSESNPEFASCLSLLREGHSLLALALSEMSIIEGVDDEVMGFSDEFFRNAIRQDPNDQIESLIARLEKHVMVFLHNKKFQLEKLAAKRREAILGLAKLHPNKEPVVSLECLRDLGMDIPFMAMGMVHVLFSEGFEKEEEAAVTVYQRLKKHGYNSLFLTSKLSGAPCLPEKWWIGACERERTIDGVLNPAMIKRPETQILIVSSLDKMRGKSHQDDSPKSRQKALLRIVRWCLDNQVLGLVFSEESAEQRPWLGKSTTLKKGIKDVDGSGVRDKGATKVDELSADRSGQEVEGPGQDSSSENGEGAEEV